MGRGIFIKKYIIIVIRNNQEKGILNLNLWVMSELGKTQIVIVTEYSSKHIPVDLANDPSLRSIFVFIIYLF